MIMKKFKKYNTTTTATMIKDINNDNNNMIYDKFHHSISKINYSQQQQKEKEKSKMNNQQQQQQQQQYDNNKINDDDDIYDYNHQYSNNLIDKNINNKENKNNISKNNQQNYYYHHYHHHQNNNNNNNNNHLNKFYSNQLKYNNNNNHLALIKMNIILLLLPILIILQLINCNFILTVQARNAFQVISDNPELSMFKNIISNETIYTYMFGSWKVTVFAPTNQAIKTFLDQKQQTNDGFTADLLKYHIVSAAIKRNSWIDASPANALNAQYPPLYLTTTDNLHKPDEKFYFVNNALVIDAIEDLSGDTPNDGQSVFIIDEVLSSMKTTRPTAPTALELIQEPSIYGLNDYDMSKFLKKIQEKQLESIFSTPGTFFIPTKIINRETPEFDEYVVKAHVIKDKPLFIRTMGDRRTYNTMAFDDNVDVELSFINKTVRFTVEQMYYIQTNTIKNDAIHKAGRVLSRMIKSNIPVKNGVVHIIEKPLMLMDMTIKDFLREQNKLKRFNKLLEKHPDVLKDISKNLNKTILAPDDNAFSNLIDNNQNFAGIGEDSDEMKKLLLNHVVYQQVSFGDLKRNAGFANYTSASGVPVMFRLVGLEPNTRLTVESGGVNATSSLSDLGAYDGILHIIDRVLGMPFNTIYDKLINNPMLNETFKIGSQGGTQNWNAKLMDKNKRYTFFAPSNTAWMEFDKANPSEFKQLDQGIYPSISRAILDRHLSAKGQYNKKDLEQTVKKVDTVQGELIISPDPTTREIYIEWEGQRAKIINSDIHGLNGVIHIIDKVLAKKRDLKVNSAININNSCCHITFYIIMGLLSFFYTRIHSLIFLI